MIIKLSTFLMTIIPQYQNDMDKKKKAKKSYDDGGYDGTIVPMFSLTLGPISIDAHFTDARDTLSSAR